MKTQTTSLLATAALLLSANTLAGHVTLDDCLKTVQSVEESAKSVPKNNISK